MSLALAATACYGLNDQKWSVEVTKSLSLAEAKATLSERIREVEDGDPILITRHGRPVAALVHPDDLEHLMRLRAAGPDTGLARLAGGWPGSDDLVREIESGGRSGGRQVPEPD